MAIITAAHRLSGFASKAEAYLTANHAGKIDASSCRIHIGANKDSGPGLDARWRLTGMARNATPLYMELPEKVLNKAMIANPDAVLGGDTFKTKVTDAAQNFISEAIEGLMNNKGKTFEEAKKAVYDAMPLVGYRNPKTHEMEAQPYIKGVTDADINSMQVPFWNISYLNKIYKQPMLQGYAKHLVTEIGVPNVWADAVSIWTQSFEGMARIANVAKTTGQHNINEAAKTRTHQMISEFVNMVADFETAPADQIYGALSGNPLTNAAIGENEKYTRFMLEQLHNALIYFGDGSSGFEGLAQQTTEIQWNEAPFEYIYEDPTNATKGADMLEMLNYLIGGWLEELNFLPTKVRICCSPTMYKCLKWSLTSKVYNQSSPLKFINEAFDSNGQKFMSTTPVKQMDNFQRIYEFCSDPMLSATDNAKGIINPFNDDDTDLMYVTFPEFHSDMSDTGLTDVVMAPVAFDNMVLPYFYGNSRDGQGRTMIKRVGSILCPVDGAVKVIRGIGKNPNYTPST